MQSCELARKAHPLHTQMHSKYRLNAYERRSTSIGIRCRGGTVNDEHIDHDNISELRVNKYLKLTCDSCVPTEAMS